jgi:membrane associated rhomboid family serine protease
MFPLRDHNPSGITPYVTTALIAVNVAVFVLTLPLYAEPGRLMAWFDDWALVPAESDPATYLTSMFLHGGFLHLAGNMLFLWIFGDNLEDRMGHGGFLAFYLASGLAAGFAHTLSAPGSPVPTVGASGAIAGVMGGYLLLFPRARVDVLFIFIVIFRVLPVPAWVMLGIWFALQLANGSGTAADEAGVAYWAHAGGFVIGVVFALPVWLRNGGPAFWRRTAGHPPHPGSAWRQSPIPAVRRRR